MKMWLRCEQMTKLMFPTVWKWIQFPLFSAEGSIVMRLSVGEDLESLEAHRLSWQPWKQKSRWMFFAQLDSKVGYLVLTQRCFLLHTSSQHLQCKCWYAQSFLSWQPGRSKIEASSGYPCKMRSFFQCWSHDEHTLKQSLLLKKSQIGRRHGLRCSSSHNMGQRAFVSRDWSTYHHRQMIHCHLHTPTMPHSRKL